MFKKITSTILAIILTLTVLLCAAPGVMAEEGSPVLYVEECVQISDTQIIIKFSEPIAINMHKSNRGPYIALRIVNDANELQWSGESPLQWDGPCYFVGSKHDTLLMEYGTADTLNVTDVLSFDKDVAKFYKEGLKVKLCIEEVPYDQTQAFVCDGLIDNITTTDGKTRLWSNTPRGWDGVYSYVYRDFDYEIDLSKLEPTSKVDDFDYGDKVMFVVESPEPEIVTEVIEEKQNSPITVIAILVGGAIIGTGLFFIFRKVGKKI